MPTTSSMRPLALALVAFGSTLLMVAFYIRTSATPVKYSHIGIESPARHTTDAPEQSEGFSTAIPQTYEQCLARFDAEYPVVERYDEDFVPPTCTKLGWENEWRICDPYPCNETNIDKYDGPARITVPPVNRHNESTHRMMHRLLCKAWMNTQLWGGKIPSVDVYVRTGCYRAADLRYMWRSFELFFPNFLGKVILVMNFGDHYTLKWFQTLPRRYNVEVVYERVPCFPGRYYPQYSYLRAFHHSKADYILTFDSDCGLHTPITPEVLFNERGEAIMLTGIAFQAGAWNDGQQYFTKWNFNADTGSAMITEPILTKRDQMVAYFDWIQSTHGVCYEEMLTRWYREVPWTWFCWMCQLTSHAWLTKHPGVEIRVLDNPQVNGTYLRYGVHYSYECVYTPGPWSPAFHPPSTEYHSAVQR